MDEVQTTLCHIAGNRASGSSGILSEMVMVCSDDVLWYYVKSFTNISDSRSIYQEWKDVLLILLSKTGDLTLCDNWHGISL